MELNLNQKLEELETRIQVLEELVKKLTTPVKWAEYEPPVIDFSVGGTD